MFKKKKNLDDHVQRFRASLEAKSFAQTFGLDYFSTYAPVACLCTLRIVSAEAVQMCLTLASVDVVAAFMNALLDGELYNQLPEGYVYRLKKCLYGLKQSLNQ